MIGLAALQAGHSPADAPSKSVKTEEATRARRLAAGNQAQLRARASAASGLRVGRADDPAEAEADRVAERALRGLDFAPPAGASPPAPVPFVHRKCDCGGEEECSLCRKPEAGTDIHGGSPAPSSVSETLSRPGRPLDPATGERMEAAFGADLSALRIHDDAAAGEASAEIGARAWTVGRHIAFAQGAHQPGTTAGDRLLAHEIAHSLQAGAAKVRRAPIDYQVLTIDQLRVLVKKGDPLASSVLEARYVAMTNSQLARFATRDDELAISVYAARKVTYSQARGQGKFSQEGMFDQLSADIKENRGPGQIQRIAPGPATPDVKVEGGTIGSARTDVPGLEEVRFIGRSPEAGGEVNFESKYPPNTDYAKLPQTHGHAEQSIADQLDVALSKIPREQLVGRRVWVLVEQEVCSTCGAGAENAAVAPGVIKKLANDYPEITFEYRNLDSMRLIVLHGLDEEAFDASSGVAATTEGAGEGAAAGAGGKQPITLPAEMTMEVTEAAPTAEGGIIAEMEFTLGDGLDAINKTAPEGTALPARILVRVTQNAKGEVIAVEPLSGQPLALVEALVQKTLGSAAPETTALAEAGAAATAARTAMLFKGFKYGGHALFLLITAYQLYEASSKDRPKVLAGAAGGLAAGAGTSYLVCNGIFGLESGGWSLLLCGFAASGVGGYAGTKASESAYEAASRTELDEAYQDLGTRSENVIKLFNLLRQMLAAPDCVDAPFVRDFESTVPSDLNDTEIVLVVAQLIDDPFQKIFIPSSGGSGTMIHADPCPSCHEQPAKAPSSGEEDSSASEHREMPSCSPILVQAQKFLRDAIRSLPPRLHLSDVSGVEAPIGTVCPSCHTAGKGQPLWEQFGPPTLHSGSLSDPDYQLLMDYITASQSH